MIDQEQINCAMYPVNDQYLKQDRRCSISFGVCIISFVILLLISAICTSGMLSVPVSVVLLSLSFLAVVLSTVMTLYYCYKMDILDMSQQLQMYSEL